MGVAKYNIESVCSVIESTHADRKMAIVARGSVRELPKWQAV